MMQGTALLAASGVVGASHHQGTGMYQSPQHSKKMLFHFANVIALGSALLILIKYGEMKVQSMSGVAPLIGVTQGFDINQRQGDINGGL